MQHLKFNHDLKTKEIKEKIALLTLEEYPEWIHYLGKDSRKSVQSLGKQLENKLKKHRVLEEKTKHLLAFEKTKREEGFRLICGVDEVGRGPLAGPVVTGAVIMKPESCILGIDDSKKLTATMRESLAEQIMEEAIDWKIGVHSHKTIDEINILEATKKAMVDAVLSLEPKPDLVLIDALKIPVDIPMINIIKGDATCYAIAAASILAKVYRDKLMISYHEQYPQYGFDRNMGYGTKEHIKAIKEYGVCPIHRLSFVGGILSGK